jgi:hypothetical protein
MCDNPIDKIPGNIWAFNQLEKLLLNNCQLRTFLYPKTKYLSLKVMEIEGNQLE